VNTDLFLEDGLEPERYELREDGRRRFDLPRRDFLKLLGGGVLVLLYLDDVAAQESGTGRRPGAGERMPRELGAWLHIGENGTVTVYTGKAEMGQNARTSLTQIVAEELPVPVSRIRMVMGDTFLTPYDAGTFGSRTTPDMVPQIRKVAATARETLIELAAGQFNTKANELEIADGNVRERAGTRSATFGELAKGQELEKRIVGNPQVTAPADWKITGTSLPKVDGEAFVTGRHQYTTDLRPQGMLHGKVLRAPALGASLVSLDLDAAKAFPGVQVIRDESFVGVVAASPTLATQALAAIRAEWKTEEQPSNRDLFKLLKSTGANEGGRSGRGGYEAGSIERGFAEADHKLEQAYTIAYIAHVPLEPRAAVAEWNGDILTVWTGTQRPFGVQSELARAFRMPEERVRVIMPDTGSGYGGKHTGDAAIEVARLAREAGKPVKLVWTRQEEFMWAYFRPAGVIEVTSGVKKDGTVTAWDFHNYNSGSAAIRGVYDFPNQRIQFHSSRSPLRQGSYRALAAPANHFARETHMDELAKVVGMDPLAFRLHNLKDTRLRDVLNAAAEKFGWGKSEPAKSHGFGIAGGFEKGSYVATCVEIVVEPSGEVRVLRVVEAFECGGVINPDHLTNQIEGMIMMGLGGALFEAIRFENGKILNGRMAQYRVPRFSDLPKIEIIMLDRRDLTSVGGGETPIVAIAPAVGNAIFHATGVRVRSMPLAPEGVTA
jgi:isoquinoline 1-oxidoreductase